jgi:predicted RNase H-like HicB family nuclease
MSADANRTTYTVLAEHHDRWWAIRVLELPNVFSQSRRLRDVEAMARDAIEILLDVPADSFNVRLTRSA